MVWGLKIKHFLAHLVRVFWVSALEPCGRDKESVVHGPAPVSSLIFTSLEGQPLRNDSCFSVLSSSSASVLTTLASLPLPVLFSISLFSKSFLLFLATSPSFFSLFYSPPATENISLRKELS